MLEKHDTLNYFVSFENPQMLDHIILNLVVSCFITNFLMHGEKFRKLGREDMMWFLSPPLLVGSNPGSACCINRWFMFIHPFQASRGEVELAKMEP